MDAGGREAPRLLTREELQRMSAGWLTPDLLGGHDDPRLESAIRDIDALLGHVDATTQRAVRAAEFIHELYRISAGVSVGGQDPFRIRKAVSAVADNLTDLGWPPGFEKRDLVLIHSGDYAGEIATILQVDADGSLDVFRHGERWMTNFLEPHRWMRVLYRPPPWRAKGR